MSALQMRVAKTQTGPALADPGEPRPARAVSVWRSAGGLQGQEVAEAALVLPLLFMILIAIFWFGQAFRIYGTITQAARQGARAAVAPVCTTCSNPPTTPAQNALTAVNSALTAASLSTIQVKKPTSPPALAACPPTGGPGVSCAYPSGSNVCVQTNVELSTSTGGSPGTCGTAVSFGYQYPYHFLIPYTSLDLGNITLPAEAEMRLETQ